MTAASAKNSKVRKLFTFRLWVTPVRSVAMPTVTPRDVISSAQTIWFVIGRREMAYQSLSDLGHDDEAEVRPISSAVDVLQAMKAMKPARS